MAIVIFNCTCGGAAKVVNSMTTNLPPSRRHGFAVVCLRKGCKVGVGPQARTQMGAIRLWNKKIGDQKDGVSEGKSKTCQRCGTCCRRQPTPPFRLGYPELADHPELRDEIVRYLESDQFDDNAPCLWLTPDGCKHYDLRPEICREYEPGCDSCAAKEQL